MAEGAARSTRGRFDFDRLKLRSRFVQVRMEVVVFVCLRGGRERQNT